MPIFIAISAMLSIVAIILIIIFIYEYFFGSFPLIKKYYKIKFHEFLLLDEDAIKDLRESATRKLYNAIINRNNNE
ncbi:MULTISPECIES: hypothetical protein [unclassified Campylobacter]|uniref:hypothetical protein n=1 Tax=unclassified Campylobacter TaxID=2593542 RepID=UPI001DA5E212|nr:hypothetical protein [Campylobacter sp. RM12651]MBZ7978517.1 hypothetical protein [Campylobacter sp. RM12654]MBZ7980434.1 hypothetical protein [Campylobacter sp. RM12642]MBZ7990593.1 hypothetical protein [Campylobacter sp. RM9331]MBZ8004768.1 hypothetical protein [Campylobacter sp. RM9332]MBZ8007115.1 hypothetical protein [Campylobacter sp. RM9334]